ncbi:unnamed protein product [Amoebophrya sp. A25]|nr:unnamed protein product [Amoebophrya sp. A25]|eukprot:GSA25T00025556001.1
MPDTIIPNVDVTDDACIDIPRNALASAELLDTEGTEKNIDVLIHNAGRVNGTRAETGDAVFANQKLDKISSENRLRTFNKKSVSTYTTSTASCTTLPPEAWRQSSASKHRIRIDCRQWVWRHVRIPMQQSRHEHGGEKPRLRPQAEWSL